MANFLGVLKFTELLFAYFLSEKGEDANSNSVISPMSAFVAMCMVNNGARGPTRDEIHSALQLTEENNFCEEAEKVMEFFEKESSEDFTLNVTNGLFTNKNFIPLALFKKILEDKYKADSKNVSFGTPQGEKVVNDWVEEKTNGKIKNILKGTKPSDLMVLVTTIFMKGFWHNPFFEKSTANGTFSAPSGDMTVDYMHGVDYFNYVESEIDGKKFKAVFMPYKNGYLPIDWNMVVILPENAGNPVDLKGLVSDKIFEAYSKSSRKNLDLKIPKSKIESDIDLKPLLNKLGIQKAFTDAANFSGIHETVGSKIDQIKQKTFIAVDEDGTEAAAATFVKMVPTSMPPPPIQVFFDSPYLFAITNPKEKVILFAGIVAEPEL